MHTIPDRLASSLFQKDAVISLENTSENGFQSPIIGFDIYYVKPGLTEMFINAAVATKDIETVQ